MERYGGERSNVVDAIAEAIPRAARAWKPTVRRRRAQASGENASLAGGWAGLAVLYGHLAVSRPGLVDPRSAAGLLDQAADAVSSATMSPSLYSGFAGVAWAMEHLEGAPPESDDGDGATAVDDTLLDLLERSPWDRDRDLVSGLVGFGVYALERLPSRAGAACLKRVVDRLEETAERSSRGISWFTRPEQLSSPLRKIAPKGCYDLGLAHGVAGVIALLGAACAAGVARRKARDLLEGAVAWLEAQRLPARAGSHFPNLVGPGIEPAASRMAWCYGDPGIAAALLLAARCVGERSWERRAIAIAIDAAKRPPKEAGVVDAGLCHGAAGLGHLFNRMYQATGERRLASAARIWISRTLALRRSGRGIAGFRSWSPGSRGAPAWQDDPGMLTGAAGVALALLAAATPVEPSWDRMLLVSMPPRKTGSSSSASRGGRYYPSAILSARHRP